MIQVHHILDIARIKQTNFVVARIYVYAVDFIRQLGTCDFGVLLSPELLLATNWCLFSVWFACTSLKRYCRRCESTFALVYKRYLLLFALSWAIRYRMFSRWVGCNVLYVWRRWRFGWCAYLPVDGWYYAVFSLAETKTTTKLLRKSDEQIGTKSNETGGITKWQKN